ncbi:MAG: Type 1 glutamine amidotransferase-like domain-containing protein [archaeon]|nr:MAG: Type 1 glutamine amidotransferase-like domain-containing protein [archaeon]
MKLLLTSAGLSNKSISKALAELAGKPFSKLKLAFIPTAANVEKGDKGWLIKDLITCRNLGFASIDIVDISSVPGDVWEPRLREADVLMFGGGNSAHLMSWMEKSGLREILPALLKDRVYVGISAGSVVATHKISGSRLLLYWEDEVKEVRDREGLAFVSFHIFPHLNSPHFPKITKETLTEIAEKSDEPMYAIDDQTAIKVTEGKTEIVTEGEYLEFNT